MEFSILKQALDGWSDLTNHPGEGLLCYAEGENSIIVKVHAMDTFVQTEDVIRAYVNRLENEVGIHQTYTSSWVGDGTAWYVELYWLDNAQSKYCVLACGTVAGRVCSIDAVMRRYEQVCYFKNHFSVIVSHIDFETIQCEPAILHCDPNPVSVVSISDMCLQSRTDDTLVFVGMNKYIAVTANIGTHHALLERAHEDYLLERIYVKSGEERYRIINGREEESIVEVFYVQVENVKLEVFGYYTNGAASCVMDNLAFGRQEAAGIC